MNDHLECSAFAAESLTRHLLASINDCSAVQSIVIAEMINRASMLKLDIDNLIIYVKQDEAQS